MIGGARPAQKYCGRKGVGRWRLGREEARLGVVRRFCIRFGIRYPPRSSEQPICREDIWPMYRGAESALLTTIIQTIYCPLDCFLFLILLHNFYNMLPRCYVTDRAREGSAKRASEIITRSSASGGRSMRR